MSPNPNYKWVVATNVLELDSPQFWHSHFISSKFAEQSYETMGTRIVREYLGRIIVVDSFPVVDSAQSQWHFYGWVLPDSDSKVIEYSDVQLNVEVLTASTEPTLYKIYDLDNVSLPKKLIEDGLTEEESAEDYAFMVLVEGHSRATLLKSLCDELFPPHVNLNVERIREDKESIVLFGEVSAGSWSITTSLNKIQGTYETNFVLWRKTANNFAEGRNNPGIMSEETQFFHGSARRSDLLEIAVQNLKDSVQSYS